MNCIIVEQQNFDSKVIGQENSLFLIVYLSNVVKQGSQFIIILINLKKYST